MSYFPDVNVWLAAMWDGHSHHQRARQWIDETDDTLILCRVTQMAILRLLSNPKVLGAHALSRSEAWRAVDELEQDARVLWREEPRGTEVIWRTMSARHDVSHKLWTDDFLAAFAQAGGFTLVTLDKALGVRHPSVVTLVLETP